MSNGMTDKPYTVLGPPVEQNQYVDYLQKVVSGRLVRAQWNATGGYISVFVPDDVDLVSTADQLIRARGAEQDALLK